MADRPFVTGAPWLGLSYPWWAIVVVTLGALAMFVDVTALNIALPTLTQELDVSRDDILWISITPMLTLTGLSMTLGRLGDLYGHKRPYVAGFVLFTLGTAAAAAAGSFGELLAARLVQSVGLACITANMSAIATAAFPPSQRGKALGLLSAAIGGGMALGPIYGGAVIDVLDWRAVFWLRVPLFAAATILVASRLGDTPPDKRARGLDIPGAVALSALLFTLVLGINRGQAWGWGSAGIIAVFVVAATLLPVLLRIELRAVSPTLALSLFRRWSFSGGVIASSLQSFGLAAASVLVPFYLVQARDLSVFEAGALMATFPTLVLIIAPVGGLLTDRIGSRALGVAGLLIQAAGLFLIAQMAVDEPIAGIALRLLVIGIARGVFDTANVTLVMGSVDTDRLGTASAAISTSRSMGQAIGVAAAGAIFTAEAAAFALARSPAGLDDPAVAPAALLHGLEWALTVSAGIALAGAVVAWLATIGSHPAGRLASAPAPPAALRTPAPGDAPTPRR